MTDRLSQLHPNLAATLIVGDGRRISDRVKAAMLTVLDMDELPPRNVDLTRLADRLDERAFDLQDAVEDGHADRAGYHRAFRRARAATALRDLEDGDLNSALYEALHALGADERALLGVITE